MAKHLLKGGMVYGMGQVASQALLLGRNIILARMLSPEDVGVAATFALTVSLLEMISDLNVGMLLIQAPDGDDPRFQRSTQLLSAIRGVGSALVLMAVAYPVAWVFRIPQAWPAFMCLAVVPLIKGLGHDDVRRLQRQMNFVPNVTADFFAQLLPFVAAYPIARLCGNYWAMLWLSILQVGAWVAVSHLTAHRRYNWGWEPTIGARMFRFGGPLLLNGLLMFGMFQGDRIVIGRFFTMADLGPYSQAVLLTNAPLGILSVVAGALLLPLLSKAQDQRERFHRQFAVSMEGYCLVAALSGVFFTVTGGWMVVFLFGPKYAVAAGYMGWLGACQAVRLMRNGTATCSLALADPYNSLVSNALRLLGPLGALAAAVAGKDLIWIASTGLLGELVATAGAIVMLRVLHRIPMGLSVYPVSMGMMMIGVGGLVEWLVLPHGVWYVVLPVSVALMAGVGALMLVVFPSLRRQALDLLPQSDVSAPVPALARAGE